MDSAASLPGKKAEGALKHPIKAWLPDDPALVNRALNVGKPLTEVGRGSALDRRLHQLAAVLCERSEPAVNGKLLR
jgi:Flp pilus assembly CpaE family ATPase